MSDDARSLTLSEAVCPPPIALRELMPWTLFGVAILGVMIFLLGMFQGSTGLHEILHDGRHLLGFPCH